MAQSPEVGAREFCYSLCPSNPSDCPLICIPFPPDFFNMPPPPYQPSRGHHVDRIVIVVAVLGSLIFLIGLCSFILKHMPSRNNTVGSVAPTIDPGQNHDSTHRDHFGRPVGLKDHEINSIAIFKYERGGRPIEATDCSVCLTEFRDHESLRLLPSCNHAFHLPCIDTWLKSHVSCPLCRSNVVVNPSQTLSKSIHPTSNSASSPEPSDGANICSSVRAGNHEFRSQSDLSDRNRRSREIVIQVASGDDNRITRSLSMDCSSVFEKRCCGSVESVLPLRQISAVEVV